MSQRKQDRRRPGRRSLTVEPLEDRSLPVGNVFALNAGGIVQIIGDELSNALLVQVTGSAVILTAIDGTTTINGLPGQMVLPGRAAGVSVQLGNGNDLVALTGVTGGVMIDMGSGDDTVLLGGVTAAGGVIVQTGDGNDTVTVAGSMMGALVIDAGAGDDHVNLIGIQTGILGVLGGEGADQTGFVNVKFSTPVVQGVEGLALGVLPPAPPGSLTTPPVTPPPASPPETPPPPPASPPAAVNNAPIATEDKYSTTTGVTLTVPAPGVLSNDTDANNDPLTVTVAAGPNFGSVTLDKTGAFQYTPTGSFTGTDKFSYTVSDGKGGTAVGVVTITITSPPPPPPPASPPPPPPPANQPPTASNDTYSTAEDTTLTISASNGVLANDSDPNGDALSVIVASPPTSGTVALTSNGGFTYVPGPHFHGTDSFTYTVTDGIIGSVTGIVTITVTPVADPPVVTTSTAVTTAPEQITVVIDPNITISDVDSDTLVGAAIQITGNYQNGQDVLGVPGLLPGGIQAQPFNSQNGILLLSGSATVADYQQALRQITYRNESNTPNTSVRTISFAVAESQNPPVASQIATKQIDVTTVNDPPLLSQSVSQVAYTEDAPPVILDAGAILNDPDSDNFNGGILTAAMGASDNADQLSILHEGTGPGQVGVSGNTVSYGNVPIGIISGGTGGVQLTVTFVSDAATPQAVQAVVRRLAYGSTEQNPSSTPRLVSVTVSDGDGGTSNAMSQQITISPVNDGPVNSLNGTPIPANPSALSVTRSQQLVFNQANGLRLEVSDPDVQNATNFTVSVSVDNGVLSLTAAVPSTVTVFPGPTNQGTITLTGPLADINTALDGLTFQAPSSPQTVTFTITSNDAGNTGSGGALLDPDNIPINIT